MLKVELGVLDEVWPRRVNASKTLPEVLTQTLCVGKEPRLKVALCVSVVDLQVKVVHARLNSASKRIEHFVRVLAIDVDQDDEFVRRGNIPIAALGNLDSHVTRTYLKNPLGGLCMA